MASIDLCVYGTPHGFDSYEVPQAMGEYCEQFYRTNRRGRMLMANRRNDGSTVYSFLVYDLVETDLRQHACFGTAFTLRGNQYIPDLRSLYGLFNQEFDRLLSTGRLLTPVGKTYKYAVGKFKAAEDVISAYFAALMAGLSNFETEYFDAGFKANASGQIALKNIDTPEKDLTDAFKKSQWLAVSPYFKPDEPTIEIDLGDMNQKYTASLELLTRMAIHKHATDKGVLEEIASYAATSMQLLKKYAAQGGLENKELQQINELSGKLSSLHSNASTLIRQLQVAPQPQPQPRPKPEPTPTPPPTPEPTPQPQTRRKRLCMKCGKVKPLTDFEADSEICKKCSAPEPMPIWKQIDPKLIGIVAVLLAILLISWALISSGGKEQTKPEPTDDSALVAHNDSVKNFERALTDGKLAIAYDYRLAAGSDAMNRIVRKYQDMANAVLTESNGEAYRAFVNFQRDNQPVSNLPNLFNFNDQIEDKALVLDEIYSELSKPQLTDNEKSILRERINKFSDYETLVVRLNGMLNSVATHHTSSVIKSEDFKNEQPLMEVPLEVHLFRSDDSYTDKQEITLSESTSLKHSDYYILESNKDIKLKQDTGPYKRKTVDVINNKKIQLKSRSNSITIVVILETGGKTYKLTFQ